jgi:hypothetical protein
VTKVTVLSHDLLFLLSLLHRRPRWQAAQERIFKAMMLTTMAPLRLRKCRLLCTATSSKRTSIADEMRDEHHRRVLCE